MGKNKEMNEEVVEEIVEEEVSEQPEEVVETVIETPKKKRAEKKTLVLDNGTEVKIGGSKPITGAEQVLVTDWNPGQMPHFSVPAGVLIDLITKGKLNSLGKFGEGENGIQTVSSDDVLEYVKGCVERDAEIEWKTTKGSGTKVIKQDLESSIEIIMDKCQITREEAVKLIKGTV